MGGTVVPNTAPAASTPATDWGAVFGKVITTAVDTGAALTLANATAKQKEALAAQQTQLAGLTAATQAQAQAASATQTAGWQKLLLYGGGGLAAVAVLVLLLRRSS